LKPNIIIRADGGTSIGMGHVIRCLALADMLKNDFNISFAIQEPSENIIKNILSVTERIIRLPQTNDYSEDIEHFTKSLNSNDIIVLDGYNFKTAYQKAIKNKGCKLVCIDDLHDWHFVADAIINHAEGIKESLYSAEKYTKFYFGLNYALLRKEFLKPFPTKKINTISKVFISMGAADIDNLTQKFTEALTEINEIEKIHLMLSSINPNLSSIDSLIKKNKKINIIRHFNISAEELISLLKDCDIIICPASSISIESCAIGTGLVVGYSAPNQLGNLEGLTKHKTIVNIGDMNAISISEIKAKFEELKKHPEAFNDLISNQKKMIDGKSPERIQNIFKNISNGK
jgi:UDP-2,4-diacetamido-2,4,6-trideoxy-beta-L-altropyranose hydrolase